MPRFAVIWVTFGVLTFVAACKTRDPNASGVLDSRPDSVYSPNEPRTPGVYNGGSGNFSNWQVVCTPQQMDQGDDPSDLKYFFSISGGTSQEDESQPIIVTIKKVSRRSGLVIELSKEESGRGAVSPFGSIFVGYPGGVLTASYGTASMGTSTHGGIMTLAGDSDAMALQVDCQVQ